jgi:hypothetical protein
MSSQEQQETFYDPETGEYYTYADQGGAPSANHKGKTAIYVIAYFALLAIFIVPASKLHLGTSAIFFAMVGAGLLLGAGILLFKFIRSKVAEMHLTGKGFAQLMVGYAPEATDQDDGQGAEVTRPAGPGRALATTTSTAIQPYGQADQGELPDAIIEDNPMYLSDMFQPNVNGMMGATVLLCGRRRSGKSNGMGVIVEELARFYTPLCLADTEDEYNALVHPDYLPRGVMAGSIDLCAEARAAGIRYIPIDREGAYEFGQSIPRDVLQVVLNLQSFTDDDEAAIIMSEIIDGMNAWEQNRPNKDRIPCMFLLDEATKWLPQNIKESCIQDTEALYMLQRAIFGTMVRRGGKRGLGLVLAAQRIAELDKRAMQSIWKFLFQQGEEIDLARYTALGLDRSEVIELRQGECFVFSPSVIGFKTMFRTRHSEHQGHTPGLAQLVTHLRRMKSLDAVSARSYTSVDASDQGDDQAAQPERTTRTNAKTLDERGIEAWNNGAMSGRKLAAALSLTEGAGNQLMNRLLAKGLIQRPGTVRQTTPSDE